MTVTVLNENGDRVAGVECTFSIHTQSGSDASVDPSLVTTDDEGKAATTLTVGSTVGTVELRAVCDGISQVVRVEVMPTTLPSTGTASNSSGGGSVVAWLVAVLAGASAAAVIRYGALRLGAP